MFLKILDVMIIKILPEKYIFKSWIKDARNEIVHDFNRYEIIIESKFEIINR